MIDPDFDPYQDLLEAQDMINQLIIAHNKHDELLLSYSKQHQQMADLLNKMLQQINKLEFEIKKIKNAVK